MFTYRLGYLEYYFSVVLWYAILFIWVQVFTDKCYFSRVYIQIPLCNRIDFMSETTENVTPNLYILTNVDYSSYTIILVLLPKSMYDIVREILHSKVSNWQSRTVALNHGPPLNITFYCSNINQTYKQSLNQYNTSNYLIMWGKMEIPTARNIQLILSQNYIKSDLSK